MFPNYLNNFIYIYSNTQILKILKYLNTQTTMYKLLTSLCIFITSVLSNLTPNYAWVDSTENIHSFFTFDGNTDVSTIDATNVDFVWGSNKPEDWHKQNPNTVLSTYIPYMWDFTGQNLSTWQKTHPDWIVYQCDRVTPADIGSFDVSLDMTNPNVIAWQIQQLKQIITTQPLYTAVATDCYGFFNHYGSCGVWQNGIWKQLYSGELYDDTFKNASITWAKYFSAFVKQLNLKFIPNFSTAGTHWYDNNMDDLMTAIDGVVSEEGFTMAGTGLVTKTEWLNKQEWAKKLQDNNKAYYPINEWYRDNFTVSENVRQFILASYLMANYNTSAIYTSDAHHYGYPYQWPEYQIKVGHALNNFYEVSYPQSGVYMRNYSNATVIVNANDITNMSQPVTVKLTQNKYIDVFNNIYYNQINVPPKSGLVLQLT